jgi:hypothetical protein
LLFFTLSSLDLTTAVSSFRKRRATSALHSRVDENVLRCSLVRRSDLRTGTPRRHARGHRQSGARFRIKFPQKTLRLTTFMMPDGKLEQYQIAAAE